MIRNKFLFAVVFILIFFSFETSAVPTSPQLGVWITVFSEGDVLYSKQSADTLIKTCKDNGINNIYLQIFRAGKAYYKSSYYDSKEYDKMFVSFGSDPINYIASECKKNNIKLHAWVNLLSVATNKNAQIIKDIGSSAVTLDNQGQTALMNDKKEPLDMYYIRENQLFLEPGNLEVRNYLVKTVAEIAEKYPVFAGIHLDYVRYPSVVPFIPGSRFSTHGLTYGYTYRNLTAFQQTTGIDIKGPNLSRKDHLKWDNWRREKVTSLVEDISIKIKKINSKIILSCAVNPSPERAYTVYFQSWVYWLKENFIDEVVTMNYSDDSELVALNTDLSMIKGYEEKVFIGVGAFLLGKELDTLKDQLYTLKALKPAGIVIFSYDDILKNPEILKTLKS
ncbi:MAG: family 10 glycosylhydrolase [Candidatus Omnitrophica bacterium]|nr:family 10 glycosylhydrolase [Candidatus Omnitrophota bacterium]